MLIIDLFSYSGTLFRAALFWMTYVQHTRWQQNGGTRRRDRRHQVGASRHGWYVEVSTFLFRRHNTWLIFKQDQNPRCRHVLGCHWSRSWKQRASNSTDEDSETRFDYAAGHSGIQTPPKTSSFLTMCGKLFISIKTTAHS